MLCDMRGRFLFEALPDLFPGGILGAVECDLWGRYYRDKHERNEK
jgi:hypothetical protein